MTHVLSAVAWPYANGPRHIGHVAGFGVPSDVFSRYMRMAGHEVLMVSGTDEHGTPILVTADKEGVSAKDLADKNNAVIVNDLADLGLSYDLFTRTTTGNHYGVVQEMFRTVLANGYMVEQTTQAAISPSTGRTLPDRYIEGTCPICGYGDARGDQCDNCGNQLDATDLINPRSKINGETPDFVDTQHFLLDLPALADALKVWLDAREAEGHLAPQRHQVQPEHPQGDPAARDDARHRLGHPGPGLGGPADQAALRVVRRGHRLPLRLHRVGATLGRSRRVAGLVERPGGPVLLLHGQGQHRLPLPDLARRAPRLQRPGLARRRAGGVRRPQPAHRGRLLGVPHDGRPAVLHLARSRALRRRLPGPLRPRPAALLHLRGRPRDVRRGLHVGRVRHPQQLRAGRGLGQPGQPHGHDDRQELRRDPGAQGRSSRSTRPCSPRSAAASRRSATCSAGTACAPPSPRPCGSSAR